MENPIKMDDLGVPLFSETPISRFFPSRPFWGFLVRPFHKGLKPRDLEFGLSKDHLEAGSRYLRVGG